MSNLKLKGNHFQNHKEARELTMSTITVDFKGTPDQIVISLVHWRMQGIKGQEDQEMTKGIGLLGIQEVKMVIPEWWMWWRWLMHSPPAYQASPEGLKDLTLVPKQWRVGEKGYLCISITTCPCINTSYVLWLCSIVCFLLAWVENCLFVCVCFKCLYIVAFWSIFSCFYVKNPKIHKK